LQVDHYPYDAELMIFMDYRDYNIQDTKKSAFEEIPTFLYAMPLSPTRVFFEETCLAARPALPFSLLQERLEARLEKMGIKVIHMHEEEWSYIPVGGTLPDTTQQHLGFGAAASMVHPATGYSVVRSLSEAPMYAAAIAGALGSTKGASSSHATGKNSRAAALEAWNALWPRERKRQRAFFLFGLELILQLDTAGVRDFFCTFFQLPEW
jgi:lycopene epsilon-cyclase